MGSTHRQRLFGFLGVLVRRRGISAPACFVPLLCGGSALAGDCPWTRETVSKWPRASPSGSEAAAEDRPSRRPRRLPSFRHRRRLHPPIARFLPRARDRGPLAPGRRRHREGGDGPPVRVGWHRGEWRRIRLLRASSSTPTGSMGSGCRAPARDQAREGRAIARSRSSLRPGDLLTFSNSGGPVTHVGLYIGDGRFIHSASHGVQVSLLSGEDPYGRWWYTRWVGVAEPEMRGGLQRYGLSACCPPCLAVPDLQ